MYFDSFEDERKDCSNYYEDLKKRIIFFKKSRIRFTTMMQPLELNFGGRGMKKLVDDFVERTSGLHIRKAQSCLIEVETRDTMAISRPQKETMVKEVEAIMKAID